MLSDKRSIDSYETYHRIFLTGWERNQRTRLLRKSTMMRDLIETGNNGLIGDQITEDIDHEYEPSIRTNTFAVMVQLTAEIDEAMAAKREKILMVKTLWNLFRTQHDN